VFEVDRSDALDAKAAVIGREGGRPRCRRVAVVSDLLDGWATALLAAGFDATGPAAFVAEGLLFYLSDDALRRVLREVSALAAPGSGLCFDIPNRHVLTSPYTRPWIEMQAAAGAPWIGTMDDPAGELGVLGWEVTVAQPGEAGAGRERWTLPVVPAAETALPHSWYVSATRLA
jgi:methyltransferase (TIGR00027 family)